MWKLNSLTNNYLSYYTLREHQEGGLKPKLRVSVRAERPSTFVGETPALQQLLGEPIKELRSANRVIRFGK